MAGERRRARFRFGAFELDAERLELRRSGLLVRLQAQPARLLGLLVERAGETVSREEIQRHLWPEGTHVEFDQGINACIKQIRIALGDSAESPRFVLTQPREGYRFLASRERIEDRDEAGGPPSGRGGRLLASGAAGLLVVAVAAVALVGRRPSEGTSDPPRPVLAVLPFEHFGSERPEGLDFADALTEELIAQLGRQYGARLAVIARTSVMKYRGRDEGIAEIARALRADYVLEGSVRRVEDRVRVVAQLIRTDDESHVWSSAFQRETDDLLQLQVELGETISRGLALNLVPDAETSGATRPEVYEVYLRGRQLTESGPLSEAVALLERAVRLDPAFARAWVALAQAHRGSMHDPRALASARTALSRALALDDELPEAHFALGMIRFYRDYDPEGARRAFERALELNPGYAEAHHGIAACYAVSGRHDEALGAVMRARRLDPLSSIVNSDVGWYYYFARRYDEAIEHSLHTLALAPDFYWARLCIQLAYLQRPDWQRAMEHARREAEAAHAPAELIERLSAHDREVAVPAYWRWQLERLQQVRDPQYAGLDRLVHVHMALGETDLALQALEAAVEERRGWVPPFLSVDPLFDRLHGDPRFERLLSRIRSEQVSTRRLTSNEGS
jgi:TolB-like protein/DNA-binding winged helix-turn-helix (wHTH) protein/Tfp pilus assembly protein PilF